MKDKSTNPGNRLTLAQIAAQTGVSRQVVAAVLDPDRQTTIRFSEETRQRVLSAVQQTNWRPNRTARLLARKRHGSLGILLDQFGTIPHNVLPFMMDRARAHGQVLTLDTMGCRQERLPLFVREDSVDAIIVFEDLPGHISARIDELGIPCVHVNTSQRTGPGCITFDEEGAMRQAADHFAKSGCYRTLLFHGEPASGYWVRARTDGLTAAACAVGMREPYLVQFDSHLFSHAYYMSHVEKIRTALRDHPRIDSVVLLQDRMAPMFYLAAESLGKRIPHDIAVVALHDNGIAPLVSPRLSVLKMNPDDLGFHIIDTANAGIAGEKAYRSPAAVQYDLRIGESSEKLPEARDER
jgi:LacI family transcriptional regulator